MQGVIGNARSQKHDTTQTRSQLERDRPNELKRLNPLREHHAWLPRVHWASDEERVNPIIPRFKLTWVGRQEGILVPLAKVHVRDHWLLLPAERPDQALNP